MASSSAEYIKIFNDLTASARDYFDDASYDFAYVCFMDVVEIHERIAPFYHTNNNPENDRTDDRFAVNVYRGVGGSAWSQVQVFFYCYKQVVFLYKQLGEKRVIYVLSKEMMIIH